MDRTKSRRGVHNERQSDSAVKKKLKNWKNPSKTEKYREKEKTSKRR